MSEWCSGFFVGPYVEFVDANGAGLPEENYESRHASVEFLCSSLSDGPSFSPADDAGPRHVFWCRGAADNTTASSGSSSYGTADLSHVVPADEIRWFTAEYAAAIEWLARHYGQTPTVRWGLVWYGYEQRSAFLPACKTDNPAARKTAGGE